MTYTFCRCCRLSNFHTFFLCSIWAKVFDAPAPLSLSPIQSCERADKAHSHTPIVAPSQVGLPTVVFHTPSDCFQTAPFFVQLSLLTTAEHYLWSQVNSLAAAVAAGASTLPLWPLSSGGDGLSLPKNDHLTQRKPTMGVHNICCACAHSFCGNQLCCGCSVDVLLQVT